MLLHASGAERSGQCDATGRCFSVSSISTFPYVIIFHAVKMSILFTRDFWPIADCSSMETYGRATRTTTAENKHNKKLFLSGSFFQRYH